MRFSLSEERIILIENEWQTIIFAFLATANSTPIAFLAKEAEKAEIDSLVTKCSCARISWWRSTFAGNTSS
jgi:hypothetical protein